MKVKYFLGKFGASDVYSNISKAANPENSPFPADDLPPAASWLLGVSWPGKSTPLIEGIVASVEDKRCERVVTHRLSEQTGLV